MVFWERGLRSACRMHGEERLVTATLGRDCKVLLGGTRMGAWGQKR